MTANHNAIWNLSGTDDPTVTPTPAPIGAEYSSTLNGAFFKKIGPGDTDWELISTTGALWAPGTGPGSVVQNNGTGNAAAGFGIAAGSNSSAGGGGAAIGLDDTASGANSTAIGNGCTASGADATAIGNGCSASGDSSTALGDGCLAKGNSSVAAGDGCVAGTDNTTFGSVAIGEGAEADATGGCALNEGLSTGQYALAINNSTARGDFSTAIGDHAEATRETQVAYASGRFAAEGDAQTSTLVLRGSTPGLVANESVELLFGDASSQFFTLEDGKAYVIKVRAVGYAHDTNFTSFEGTFAANQEGGIIMIKTAPPVVIPQVAGTMGAATWTLTANTGTLPTRITLTLATGIGTTAAVRIAADIAFVEIARS